MITREQKVILEKKIYGIISDILSEGKKKKKKDEESEDKRERIDRDSNQQKRRSVMQWLRSAQELHSVLAYELYHMKDKDENAKGVARSKFSKKYRGKDSSGKTYSFSDEEINKLYNIKNKYIAKIS